MGVERAGLVVQRVNKNRPHPDRVPSLDAATDRITQQMAAQDPALIFAFNRNRDNRITGTGPGILRRTRPGASARATDPDASA